MELITLKTLTVGMLISTAISSSVVPMVSTSAVNSNEIVSAVELAAEANIDVPAKTLEAKKAVPAPVAPKQETTVARAQAVTPKPIIKVSVPSSAKLDAWIEGLIQKESSGQTNIKILDTNNRYSYGCLQFQMGTFIAYGKKYGFISGTEANLESLIMSCSLQKSLAKKMILDDHNNWRHWYHSVATRGLGLPPIN